ncbi:hypothetical protein EHS13_20030 [Paenibacillus psychroresistens]|uniref:DUF5405 domain-containing protein n=1 Tax=Paenibacillus psychroresistens TaxID=1778678 RepID=A0A6B8RLW3_9BACL|nr:hypothetical protein [Paenibacillus psychroresistens]QGQ97009.1 hypothetical protein EHS13_20030 [Paenibacillus psychroresistens]
MRIVIEKFYDNEGVEIGELVIESDGMQFSIRKYKKSEKAESGFNQEIHGHYLSLAGAVKGVVRMKIMESTTTTLRELIEDLKRIEAWIHEQIQI